MKGRSRRRRGEEKLIPRNNNKDETEQIKIGHKTSLLPIKSCDSIAYFWWSQNPEEEFIKMTPKKQRRDSLSLSAIPSSRK